MGQDRWHAVSCVLKGLRKWNRLACLVLKPNSYAKPLTRLHRPQQTVEDARFWLTEARPILRSRLFFEGPIDNVCAGITEAHVINFALYSKKPIAFETACAACL